MTPHIWADPARQASANLGLNALAAHPGEQTLLSALQNASAAEAEALMRAAIHALVSWQLMTDASALPAIDEGQLRQQLQHFEDWCVRREFGREWTPQERGWWAHSCQALVSAVTAQPQGAVHGAFTPSHLIVRADAAAGDLLAGPCSARGAITHDIASLLRSGAIAWEEEQELDWAIRYWEQARRAGLALSADFGVVWRQLEWVGLQRHLSLIGQLCRLKHGEDQSIDEQQMQRCFAHASKVATRYIELSPLTHLLESLQGRLVQTGFTLR